MVNYVIIDPFGSMTLSRPCLGHFHVNLSHIQLIISIANSQVYSQFCHWSNMASLIPLVLWYCQAKLRSRHCTAENQCVIVDLSSDCTETWGTSVIFSGNFPAFTCFLNHILSCKPWGMINRSIFSLQGAKEALWAIIMYSDPPYLPTVHCLSVI